MVARPLVAPSTEPPDQVLGRYTLYGEIASGGMATVYLGRLVGPVGFARTVAIKRLHSQFAKDPEFVSMFLDEARLVARIRHPNVVPTLDVVSTKGELFLVMEYVEGESLSRLLHTLTTEDLHIPLPIVSAIMIGVLHGLHAAHEVRDEQGRSLELVHRDVSPQNVLLGRDGVARLLDFGVAKALGRVHTTQDGRVKGKLGYMSPEQLRGEALTRRSDIFAAGVVLWELAAKHRLFAGESEGAVVEQVLFRDPPPLEEHRPEASGPLLELVRRALARAPADRFASARQMADALEGCVAPSTFAETSKWVERVAQASFAERAERVARMEAGRPSGGASVVAPIAGTRVGLGEPSLEQAATRVDQGRVETRLADSRVSGVSMGGPPAAPAGALHRGAPTRAAVLLVGALAAGAWLAVALGGGRGSAARTSAAATSSGIAPTSSSVAEVAPRPPPVPALTTVPPPTSSSATPLPRARAAPATSSPKTKPRRFTDPLDDRE